MATDLIPLCGSWIELEDVRNCSDNLSCADDALAEESIEIASYLLWLLSEKRFPGVCETTVRPCAEPWANRWDERRRLSLDAFGWDVSWGWAAPWGWCCDRSHDALSCGCGGPSKIRLGQYPVRYDSDTDMTVTIEGVTLDPSEYLVVDRRWLLRMADDDGNAQAWPCCQRLDRPLGDPDTWSVTFKYGTAPPRAGRRACAAYAQQWARACCSDDSCVLPAGVQSIARRGVSVTMLDPQELVRSGFTGVPLVDNWLGAERFGQRRQPAVFVNPDDFAPAHRTGSSGVTYS